jgi:hypothetical protein
MTASAGPALQRLYDTYGDRVQFLTLYVREAHPGDRYVQPQDMDTKMAHARAYAQRDGIRWPVAVDDVGGTLHRRLDPKPDAAYLVDTDGVVIFRSLWANHPGPIEKALQAAAGGRKGPLGQNETKLPSMLRGTGTMWATLSAAGPGRAQGRGPARAAHGPVGPGRPMPCARCRRSPAAPSARRCRWVRWPRWSPWLRPGESSSAECGAGADAIPRKREVPTPLAATALGAAVMLATDPPLTGLGLTGRPCAGSTRRLLQCHDEGPIGLTRPVEPGRPGTTTRRTEAP